MKIRGGKLIGYHAICSCHTPVRFYAWRVIEPFLSGAPRRWAGRLILGY